MIILTSTWMSRLRTFWSVWASHFITMSNSAMYPVLIRAHIRNSVTELTNWIQSYFELPSFGSAFFQWWDSPASENNTKGKSAKSSSILDKVPLLSEGNFSQLALKFYHPKYYFHEITWRYQHFDLDPIRSLKPEWFWERTEILTNVLKPRSFDNDGRPMNPVTGLLNTPIVLPLSSLLSIEVGTFKKFRNVTAQLTSRVDNMDIGDFDNNCTPFISHKQKSWHLFSFSSWMESTSRISW